MKNSIKKGTLITRAKKLMHARIHMPEAQSGDFSIEHKVTKKGQTLPVVTMRDAIFNGLPMCNLTANEDIVVHWLKSKEYGSWMSDMPCELIQMEDELARHAKGNVLIGGLGLGIVANMVARKKSVNRIVVVEQSPDVIKLVGQYLPPHVEIVQEDINAYLCKLAELACHGLQFNCILLDTWQGTGEWCWQSEVVPMRRKIGSYLKPSRVLCWHELTMMNQVNVMLYRSADTDEKLLRRRSTCHYYAFRCAVRDAGIRVIPCIDHKASDVSDSSRDALTIDRDNRSDIDLQWMAQQFFFTIGTSSWEQNFGKYWDEAWSVKSGCEDEEDKEVA